jgi:hypothetical protein
MSPFIELYRYHPPSITSPWKWIAKVHAVEDHIGNQKVGLKLLNDKLYMEQNRMKQYADKHHSENGFEMGNWVFFSLQPYK